MCGGKTPYERKLPFYDYGKQKNGIIYASLIIASDKQKIRKGSFQGAWVVLAGVECSPKIFIIFGERNSRPRAWRHFRHAHPAGSPCRIFLYPFVIKL
jgi:hypothetical protein